MELYFEGCDTQVDSPGHEIKTGNLQQCSFFYQFEQLPEEIQNKNMTLNISVSRFYALIVATGWVL